MRSSRSVIALGLALLVASSASIAQTTPKPLLWKVSDGDNSVYLLGSFHALKPADYPLAASVDAAFADAEALAFEMSPEEMNSPQLGAKLVGAARLAEGQTLKSSISAAEWLRLEAYASKRGFPLANFQGIEPWFVSMVISLQEMAANGYDPKIGLDQHLMGLAARAGKRTSGLESADDQIAALDSMTPIEQQQTLSETLDEAHDPKGKIDELHDVWRRGDATALEKTMVAELQLKYPKLYKRINVDRNQAWLPKVRAMLDNEKSDDTMVVVGSLHLVGADGLVSQLQSRGYKVEKL
ncbi:MAG: TraB/GumN family protein [Gammaproteobacteria bacterium]|nr:TraB/GumN family protein [Gammaproteobacteria bacterium]